MFGVEKLTSDNYHNWKFDMKMVLVGRDLWDIVTGDEVAAEANPNAEQASPRARNNNSWRKRDNKALSLISLAISPDLKIYVRAAKSSMEAWNSLSKHFEEKTLSKKIMYRRQLYELRMKDGSMTEHVNKLRTISEHLEALEDEVLEKDLVMILLSSLPAEYNNLITTLETLREENLTWEYVRDRVLTEYERRKGQGEIPPHEALYVGSNSSSRQGNQSQRRHTENPSNNNKGTSRFPCHYCGEIGHFQRECENKKNDELEKENKRKQELEEIRKRMEELGKKETVANFCKTNEVKTNEEDDFVPIFALHVGDSNDEKDKTWLLDSACSSHITGEVEDLVNYQKFDGNVPKKSQYVTLADKSVVKATGQGNLNTYLKDSKGNKIPVTLKDVLFVPKMKRLVSVGQLTKAGGEVTFKAKSAVLKISGRSFHFGTKVGKLYNMNYCNFASVEEKEEEVNEEKSDLVEVEKLRDEGGESDTEFQEVIEVKSNVDVEETESNRSDQIDSASAVNDGAIPCETVCSGARHRDSSAAMCRDDFDCDFNCDCVGSSKVLNVNA